MKWKVRFYVAAPRDVPLDFGIPIGTFGNRPVYPNWDGQRGWCFEVYTNNGDDSADAMRSVMPQMMNLINQLNFVTGLNSVVVFNVHQVFRTPTDNVSLTNDEIISLDLTRGQFLQRLFVFPSQPPVQSSQQGLFNVEIADVHEVRNRNITQEILQEIRNNLV